MSQFYLAFQFNSVSGGIIYSCLRDGSFSIDSEVYVGDCRFCFQEFIGFWLCTGEKTKNTEEENYNEFVIL